MLEFCLSKSTTRWLLAIGLLAVLMQVFSGCQSQAARDLRGTWELEGAEQLAELMMGGQAPSGGLGGLIDSAVDLVADQVEARMEVDFDSGGQLVTRTNFGGKESQKQGTWKVVRTSPDEVVLWCQLDQEDPTEIKVAIVDQDTIKMVPPNIAVLKKSFTFHRVQE